MNTAIALSVIIPTLNEADWIGATLQSLLVQCNQVGACEVIVVDTGSTDATCEIVARFPVTLLRVAQRSPYVARNFGVQRSVGERLVFLDARCLPRGDWLEAMLDFALVPGHDYVAGRTETRVVFSSLGSRLLAHRLSPEFLHQCALAGNVAAGNMLVHRRVFDTVGCFSEVRSGSDIQLSQRAVSAGFAIAYAHLAVVELQCVLSTWGYLSRRFRILRGQTKHAEFGPSVLRRLVGVPWRPGWRQAVRLAPMLKASKLSALAFLWAERWANYAGALVGSFELLRRTGKPK